MTQSFRDFLIWLQAIDTLVIDKAVSSLIALLVLWALRKLIVDFIEHRKLDQAQQFKIKKSIDTAHKIFVVFVFWQIWFIALESYVTYLGLLSAGFAIALKDPIANFFAWIFILWRHPFEIGDRIEVTGVVGDVVDQRLFSFTLMEVGNWVHADQSTGRIIHVPNSRVFNEALANYTKGIGCIWNEISVTVTFESDWKEAKRLLTEIVEAHALQMGCQPLAEKNKKYLILPPTQTPIVYTSGKEYGVLLTARYLCNPRQRRGSTQSVWEAMLTIFGENPNIHFAYPAQRIYLAENGTF